MEDSRYIYIELYRYIQIHFELLLAKELEVFLGVPTQMPPWTAVAPQVLQLKGNRFTGETRLSPFLDFWLAFRNQLLHIC